MHSSIYVSTYIRAFMRTYTYNHMKIQAFDQACIRGLSAEAISRRRGLEGGDQGRGQCRLQRRVQNLSCLGPRLRFHKDSI